MSGFSQRKPEKRAKSLSHEQSIRPCSIASAAKCASGIRLARDDATCSKAPRTSWCRSVGAGIQATGDPSQALTCSHADAVDSGVEKIRGLVTSRRKASRLGQGSPTAAVPLRRASSHRLAASCCGKELVLAYTNRFASTRINENLHLPPWPMLPLHHPGFQSSSDPGQRSSF